MQELGPDLQPRPDLQPHPENNPHLTEQGRTGKRFTVSVVVVFQAYQKVRTLPRLDSRPAESQ
jgi:hypothetical protein